MKVFRKTWRFYPSGSLEFYIQKLTNFSDNDVQIYYNKCRELVKKIDRSWKFFDTGDKRYHIQTNDNEPTWIQINHIGRTIHVYAQCIPKLIHTELPKIFKQETLEFPMDKKYGL